MVQLVDVIVFLSLLTNGVPTMLVYARNTKLCTLEVASKIQL